MKLAIHNSPEWQDFKDHLRATRIHLMNALASEGLTHDQSNFMRGQIHALHRIEQGDKGIDIKP